MSTRPLMQGEIDTIAEEAAALADGVPAVLAAGDRAAALRAGATDGRVADVVVRLRSTPRETVGGRRRVRLLVEQRTRPRACRATIAKTRRMRLRRLGFDRVVNGSDPGRVPESYVYMSGDDPGVMKAERYSWNVVALAAWNLSILSPDGVRKRLFCLPDGIPIEVEIAIDKPGRYSVHHADLIVIPQPGRLEVLTKTPTEQLIEQAANLCVTALRKLPETPVSAVGVNFRYKFAELPNGVIDLIATALDTGLADAAFYVPTAKTVRSIDLTPGTINVEITHDKATGGGSVEFNFNRDSIVPGDLIEWLERVPDFAAIVRQISQVIGVADAIG